MGFACFEKCNEAKRKPETNLSISSQEQNDQSEIQNNQEKKECFIKGAAKSVPMAELPIIINQCKKCICKISNLDNMDLPGFFCSIPFPDNKNRLPVLIFYSKNIEIVGNNKSLQLNLDQDKLVITIKLDKSRKIFFDGKYKIAIIEIKKNDGFDINSFLEIDDQIFEESIFERSNYISIYILYYPTNEEGEHSCGILKKIKDDYNIFHTCKIKEDSLGYPLLNSDNKKLIGINLEQMQNKKGKNSGQLLVQPIFDFNKKYNENFNEKGITSIEQYKTIKDKTITILYDFNSKESKTYLEELEENSSLYKILGEKFVNNNKDKCKMIIKNKEYELSSLLSEELKKNTKDLFEIKLKGINEGINFENIFAGCKSLKLVPDIDELDITKISSLRGFFAGCTHLSYLPDIGKWRTNNLKDISYMFYNCEALSQIPDIGKWNVSKVVNMEYLFAYCRNIKSLPDISGWKTDNVINMKFLFGECYSVTEIPDISNWNTENVTDMSMMFFGDRHLTSLPDISKWNTKNVTSVLFMFGYCVGITSFPDFSKWDTNKIKGPLRVMFMNIRRDIITPNLKSFYF